MLGMTLHTLLDLMVSAEVEKKDHENETTWHPDLFNNGSLRRLSAACYGNHVE